MGDLLELVAQAIGEERSVGRYFYRRSIDKTCYEVVHDTDPYGAITNTSLKVVAKFNVVSQADEEVERLENLSIARAAIGAMREALTQGSGSNV